MTDAITRGMELLIAAVDAVLGWMLYLPRDLALLLLAVLSAVLMTVARRFVANQELLGRCAADLRQLKQLQREARSSKDKAALVRLRSTVGQIKGLQLIADMKVLAVVLIPVAILALWATERFDYLPPQPGQSLTLTARFPASSIDRVTHVVPHSNLGLKTPAVQIVRSNRATPPSGIAEWTLLPTEASDVSIIIRHQDESVSHRVRIGGRSYLPPQQVHSQGRIERTEVDLTRYRPLGSDLASDWIGLPPWMIGYVLLTLVLVPALRRLLRVA